MRRALVSLFAFAVVGLSALPAGAASTSSNVAIGPNAKLSSDHHTITLAAKVKCKTNDPRTILARAKQNSTIGSGQRSMQCSAGSTKTITIDVKDPAHEFTTGSADACIAAPKKGHEKSASPTCKSVTVIS